MGQHTKRERNREGEREREEEKREDYNSTCNELLTNSKCINNKLLSGRRIEWGGSGK